MKYFLSIILLSFCLSSLSAQEKHFIFIQTDNNQPFYVFLNGKLYSSTAAGYIIIPKLTDGTYNFSIGFAKNAIPEQSFQWSVNNKDYGFDLKNFGEKGWGLFDLQSLSVAMAESGKTDDISKALSDSTPVKEDVDPLISFSRKKKDAVAKRPVSKKSKANSLASEKTGKNENQEDSAIKGDSLIAETNENKSISSDNSIANPSIKSDEPVTTPSASTVEKVSESKKDDGVHLSYVEDNRKNGDTIHIIIPTDKSLSNSENNNSSETDKSNNEAAATNSSASVTEEASKDSLKFLDMNLSGETKKDDSKKDMQKDESARENSASAITNSKCTNVATDADFARLRRKMAMATTDEKMINEAKKVYKNKCFTTRQIKSLSTLFLSDEGRYNFFNASYNSVTDISEYSTLQSEFIDPAFVDRFKAMLK